jgi:hypothetical protein
MKRIHCVSSFEIPLPPAQAIQLFTPEGERLWAGEDWDPRYPVALATGATGAERGTVFVTGEDDAATIWVAMGNDAESVTYARVTPRTMAGIVSVRCTPAGTEATTVEVTYEATSLTDAADAQLDEFAQHYDAFIASWEQELQAVGLDGLRSRLGRRAARPERGSPGGRDG